MMDDDVEARLREALRLHAAESPAGATMLAAVRTITVRRKRRRHSTWAGALAVLFVLSAAAVPGMLRRPQPFAAPSPIVHSVLVAGTPISVEFPYTLHGATPVLEAGRPTLRDNGFEVWTTSVAPTGTSSTPLAVRKKLGAIVDTGRPALVWSETPGQWLVVTSDSSSGGRSDLLSVAEALVDAPSAGVVPFTFAVMPDGYTTDNVDAYVVTFCPPGVTPSASFLGKIAVMLDDTSTSTGTGDQVVVAGGRKAFLRAGSDAVTLSIPEGGGRSLVVQDTMAVHLSQQDLLDFAGGIDVTSDAMAGSG